MSRERLDSSLSVGFLKYYDVDVSAYLDLKARHEHLRSSFDDHKGETTTSFFTILTHLQVHVDDYFSIQDRMGDELAYFVSDLYNLMLRLYAVDIVDSAILKQLIAITIRDRIKSLDKGVYSFSINIPALYEEYENIVVRSEDRKFELDFEIAIDPCVALVYHKNRICSLRSEEQKPERIMYINSQLSFCDRFLVEIKDQIVNSFIKEWVDEGFILEKKRSILSKLLSDIIELRVRLFHMGRLDSPSFIIHLSKSLHSNKDFGTVLSRESAPHVESVFFSSKDVMHFYRNECAYLIADELRKMKYELSAMMPRKTLYSNIPNEKGEFKPLILSHPPRP